jgi:hypothetical protein
MKTNISFWRLSILVIVIGVLFGGYKYYSKPRANDVRGGVEAMYGECSQWVTSDVEPIEYFNLDDDPIAGPAFTVGVKYSFVISLKNIDPSSLRSEVSDAQAENRINRPVDYCTPVLSAILKNSGESNSPLAAQYKITEAGEFVLLKRRWIMVDGKDNVAVVGVEPLHEVVGQASPVVMAPNATTGNTGTAAATAAVASLPAESSPASVPVATPVADASNPLAAQSDTNADQPMSASQAPANKLQLLLHRAQYEFGSAQYQSAVATAEAILLLDPTNMQAQQLRAKALRLVQRTAQLPPSVSTRGEAPAPTLAPASPPPQPATHPLGTVDLDGDWHGTYQCGPYIGSGTESNPDAWTWHVTMTMRNGQATLVRQRDGDRGIREVLSGDVMSDLSLHLGGTGQRIGAKHPWSTEFLGRFGGTINHTTFQASGTLSNWHGEETRACRLLLSRY